MDSESEILASEVGKLGGIGARWVARLLPTNSADAELTVALSPDRVRQIILGILGTSVSPATASSPSDPVRAVVGSGHLSLNPALLSITITSHGSTDTRIAVRGAAKEGLVKQRGGEEVTARFMSQLAAALSQAEPNPGPQR
jgi:hypothetical protein